MSRLLDRVEHWVTYPKNIWIYPNRFYVFLKCGILRNLFSIPERKVCFLFCWLFIKKNYYDRYYDIKQTGANKTNKNEKPPLIFWSVFCDFWHDWPLWRHAYECACVCHRRAFSSQLFTLWCRAISCYSVQGYHLLLGDGRYHLLLSAGPSPAAQCRAITCCSV